VAIATSERVAPVDAALRHFPARELFDGVITGDHLTQKKPAPEAFLVTACCWESGEQHGRRGGLAQGIRARGWRGRRSSGFATSRIRRR